MDGITQAAILLLSMGEENAAEVIRHLEPKEVQKVGTAMASTDNVSRENMKVVLNEFINEMENQTSLAIDAAEYLRRVLIAALGEDRASPFIDTILVNDKDSGLNQLKWLDGKSVSVNITCNTCGCTDYDLDNEDVEYFIESHKGHNTWIDKQRW